MREIELSLNQTQKIRLQRALEKLQSLSSKSAANASVTVADTIPVNNEDNILKGHGTLELDGEVVATVCGVVDRVDKLVIVRSLRSRYKPDTGDIIVGRVVEVAQKRWRVEIHSNQDAVLMLSSVTLPDGIQEIAGVPGRVAQEITEALATLKSDLTAQFSLLLEQRRIGRTIALPWEMDHHISGTTLSLVRNHVWRVVMVDIRIGS
uniref:RRP4 S1 domain-containing protein n=1 Tax=Chenopodium quinoa TaxID=63459 RepID=A0A803L3Q8_CHEQI